MCVLNATYFKNLAHRHSALRSLKWGRAGANTAVFSEQHRRGGIQEDKCSSTINGIALWKS